MPAKISTAIRQRAKRIKLFLCDVDGVLTDGSIFIADVEAFELALAADEDRAIRQHTVHVAQEQLHALGALADAG